MEEINNYSAQQIIEMTAYWNRLCCGCRNMSCSNTWGEISDCMKLSKRITKKEEVIKGENRKKETNIKENKNI
jgi:hypothetical protein